MNKILTDITERRNGHYCHALEVNSLYELEETIGSLVQEFQEQYSKEEIMTFFNTISIYCLEDKNEKEIYDFDISEFLEKELIQC